MKGKYNIKTDPTIPPSPTWKMESSHRVQGGDRKGASRDGPAGNHHQAD